MYIIARGFMLASARKAARNQAVDSDPTAPEIRYLSTLTTLGSAMAEGVGLFGIVIFLLSQNPLALLAPAGTLLVLIMRFPTRARVDAFIADIRAE